ncbi:hypothetical protein IQ244_27725 [Nostoc sp. LEGE 06077]|nr:hypothetical protein [Nostoc sp. LEGE 06077]
MDNLDTCESEIKDSITSSLEPMPEAVPQSPENSIYNFNVILDQEGE